MCAHKTVDDHSYLTPGGRVWICSNCGERQRWGPNWQYWGNVECTDCGTARVDWVVCSENCRMELIKRQR
jgi:hypothetical protein